MGSKVFLDANILLDLTLKREHYPSAKRIMEWVENDRTQAFITPSIVHILGHYLTKSYGSIQAKEIILTVLIYVTVIDIPHEVTITALNSRINDIEDSLQYYAAIHNKLDYFISRDKQLQKSSIPVLPVCSPEEFIANFITIP
jgi:predicted nucleic acid-binding protein